MQNVKLGPFEIGDETLPVLLAEIGALFNQDVELACRMIDSIAKARDAVSDMPLILKSEILHDPDVCLDDESEEAYQSKDGQRKSERYRDLIERKALPLETYARILGHCREAGLPMIMSVYDYTGAEFAIAEGVVALKMASSNLNHYPLIRFVAELGKPMLIDTGRATLGEVETAVRLARRSGAPGIVVQHSPDGHPAPPENHNMRSLQTIRQALDVPVGLSCHSTGTDMLIMALSLGAKLLEKNVVFDDTLLEQDHAISANLADLPDLLSRIHDAALSLGQPFRDPANDSGLISTSARMCLAARRDLKPGDTISEDTIRFAFPCRGISVDRFDDVAGWRIRAEISTGHPVRWDDVEP